MAQATMELGTLGAWVNTSGMTAEQAAAFAGRLERWGYGALWVPEGTARNVVAHAAWLLARTATLVVASGIANIYARDAQAAAAARMTLAEQSGGRFLLGLGVSHRPLVEGVRGHAYQPPVAAMAAYLDGIARARYDAPAPAERPPTVLAALGPKMLALARDQADGAHPYLVTPSHTAKARAVLGKDKWLCPEQTVLLESDPAKARRVAREALASYLRMENYRASWLRQGFDEADFADGGSDRLIDALVAWGDERAVRARLQEHWHAGADHVCIQALHPTAPASARLPDERLLALLAPSAV